MKERIVFIAFLCAIYLVVAGAYEIFIGVTTFSKPAIVGISEVKTNLPLNRHIKIVGGKIDINSTVTVYESRKGVKVEGSQFTYLPIREGSKNYLDNDSPIILLRINEEKMNKIRSNHSFDENIIEGVRMTHFDLKTKAKEFFQKRYSKKQVDEMIVIDYKKDVNSIYNGLTQFVGGLLLLGGIITLGKSS
jgi:hypothetical protein